MQPNNPTNNNTGSDPMMRPSPSSASQPMPNPATPPIPDSDPVISEPVTGDIKLPKEKKKSKAGRVILIILIVLLVLCGGAAIWYFCFYNNPDKVFADAAKNYLSADRVQFEISSTGTNDGKTTNANATLKAAKGSPVAFSSELTTGIFNTGKTAVITADAVLDPGKMLYVKLGGLTDTVSNILGVSDLKTAEEGAEAVIGAVETITETDIDTSTLDAASEITNNVATFESTWFGINLAKIGEQIGAETANDPVVTGYISCATEAFQKTTVEDYAAFLQAHPFITLSKYNGSLAESNFNQTAYSVNIDSAKLAAAINDFDQFTGSKNFSSCISQKFKITLDHNHQVSAADIDAAWNAANHQLILTITNFGHKLIGFTASYNANSVSVVSKASISYPETLSISTPSEYTPASEVFDSALLLISDLSTSISSVQGTK